MALKQEKLKVQVEVPIKVRFRGEVVGMFRADLIVNGAVLIELKASESIIREHEAQTLHYLRATNIEVALLMNFGSAPRFKRLMMDNDLKTTKNKSVSSVMIGVKPFAPGVLS